MFEYAKSISDMEAEDLKVVIHLLESYKICYWCYWQEKDRKEDFKQEDIREGLLNLDALERVISYHSRGNTGQKLCKDIRDSLQAKERIAKGLSQ